MAFIRKPLGLTKLWGSFCGMRGRFVVLLFAVGFLSSCALLKSPPPPRDTYDLVAPTVAGQIAGGTPAQVLVKLPTALKSIDSNRMVVRTGRSEITYLAGTQWSDTVPRLVQAKLVEVFENTGATGATAKPGDGLVIDVQLVADLRRFEVQQDKRRVLIEMSLKLLSDKSGRVIASKVFTATAATAGDEASDYVSAFDRAFEEFAVDVVSWVLAKT